MTQLLKLGSKSSEVSWDLLFMLVSWWCKSEMLWDVLLKHTYVCRERLSLHSGGVLQGSICSQLSPVQLSDRGRRWQERVIVSLPMWLWRPGRPVKGRGRKVGQRREGRGLLKTVSLPATPSVIVMSISVLSLDFSFVFVAADYEMDFLREYCIKQKEMSLLTSSVFIYIPSEEKLFTFPTLSPKFQLYFLPYFLGWGKVFPQCFLIKLHT